MGNDQCQDCLRGFSIPVLEENYDAQLAVKVKTETEKWSSLHPKVSVVRSEPLAHRLRVKFFIGRSSLPGSPFRFGMNNKVNGSNVVSFVLKRFPAATQRINLAMEMVLECVNKDPLLASHLHQVSFLDVLSQDDMVLSLYYSSGMDPEMTLSQRLLSNAADHGIMGRLTVVARLKKISRCLSSDPSLTTPVAKESGLFDGKVVFHSDGSFSNPNGIVTKRVNDWLEAYFSSFSNRTFQLIELCSGSGNHTVGLSRVPFSRILSVEIDGALVDKARINVQANDLTNVQLVQGDIRKLPQIMRRFGFDQVSGQLETVVLLDPPRSGIDSTTAKFIASLPACSVLVYIACGEGLDRNMQDFLHCFELVELCLADHFPFTHFLEKIAVFRRSQEIR